VVGHEVARGCKIPANQHESTSSSQVLHQAPRSRWYQSGIKRLPLMHQGRYPTSALSILSPVLECEGTPHLLIATLTEY
jgi:hypothetical protein